MRAMLDFDSTTADLIRYQADCCNARFGTDYHHDQVSNWNWWFDHTAPEHHDYVWGAECFLSRDWTLAMPPVAGAIDVIHSLLNQGHSFFVLSDRHAHMGEWLESWFSQYNLSIPIHTTDNQPGNTKLDVARELRLDLAIEDAPHHATSMPPSGVFERVLLMDKPWNRNVPDHPRLTRVFGWGHALSQLIL